MVPTPQETVAPQHLLLHHMDQSLLVVVEEEEVTPV
tara:strand:+ start:38 stop:145 length:108 start_codon:yes stop_codon:yes gene_type:complete